MKRTSVKFDKRKSQCTKGALKFQRNPTPPTLPHIPDIPLPLPAHRSTFLLPILPNNSNPLRSHQFLRRSLLLPLRPRTELLCRFCERSASFSTLLSSGLLLRRGEIGSIFVGWIGDEGLFWGEEGRGGDCCREGGFERDGGDIADCRNRRFRLIESRISFVPARTKV